MSTFSGAWRHQKRRDPTRTATFQTVSLGEVRHSLGPDGLGSQFHSAYLPRILRKSEFLT